MASTDFPPMTVQYVVELEDDSVLVPGEFFSSGWGGILPTEIGDLSSAERVLTSAERLDLSVASFAILWGEPCPIDRGSLVAHTGMATDGGMLLTSPTGLT